MLRLCMATEGKCKETHEHPTITSPSLSSLLTMFALTSFSIPLQNELSPPLLHGVLQLDHLAIVQFPQLY